MSRTLEISVEIPDEVSDESLQLAESQARELILVFLQQRGELTIGEAAMELGLSYEEYLELLAKKGLPAGFDGTDASVIDAFERWMQQKEPIRP
jgi:predicted HTH domain antitoxin